MEKLPKELLSEDQNTRVSVAYEAETAVMKGKFQKKEHRKQMGVFLVKGTVSNGMFLPDWCRSMRFASNT